MRDVGDWAAESQECSKPPVINRGSLTFSMGNGIVRRHKANGKWFNACPHPDPLSRGEGTDFGRFGFCESPSGQFRRGFSPATARILPLPRERIGVGAGVPTNLCRRVGFGTESCWNSRLMSWTAAGSEAHAAFGMGCALQKRCRRCALPPHSMTLRVQRGQPHPASRLGVRQSWRFRVGHSSRRVVEFGNWAVGRQDGSLRSYQTCRAVSPPCDERISPEPKSKRQIRAKLQWP